jgi:hypothetical protein
MSNSTEVMVHEKPMYEVVRQASGLSVAELPDARLHAVFRFAGAQLDNPYDLAIFLAVAHRHGLDPLMGEVFAFKAKGRAVVYAGRDGFLKAATRSPDYNGHEMGLVFEKDDFRVVKRGADVQVHHDINAFDRGELVGGYCIAYGRDKKPVIVMRRFADYEYLWGSTRKENWQRDPHGMFENRLLRAALCRVVSLSDLHIEGAVEDFDTTNQKEHDVGKSTAQKLQEVRVKLGLEQPDEIEDAEVEVINESPADLEALREKVRAAFRERNIPSGAVIAWAVQNASVPDSPPEWDANHLTYALGILHEDGGREFLVEYGRDLLARDDTLGFDARLGIEEDLLNETDLGAIRKIVDRLAERVPSQAPHRPS